jgi:alpha-tubulin suppressor-like RCC1 family protein
VMCWGHNDFGQLGDGSALRRSRPVRVEGLAGAEQVAAGGAHSCALRADRTAVCWGLNGDGQIGDRTGVFVSVPSTVVDGAGTTLGNIVQIAAGAIHTCAVIGTGAASANIAMCWGDNSQGQLGDGTLFDRNAAAVVATLPAGVRQITAGNFHTCALIDDEASNRGVVRCWGINGFGQLGNEEYAMGNSSQPISVTGLVGVERIASRGDFTCAVRGGSVLCWGSGGAGQMGDGTYEGRRSPSTTVSKVTGATLLASGGGHACVLAASGLECWGASNFGQRGDATYESIATPVAVTLPAGRTVTGLAAGDQHTCALLDDGRVTCWGDGRAGQLGNGAVDRPSRAAPLLPCP